MAAHTPFATLVSFGSMIFTGAGAPAGILTDTAPLQVKETATRPASNGLSLQFVATHAGYSAGPLSAATVTATLAVVAADQSDPLAALCAVEDAVGGWWNAWTSSYLWDGNSASGQVGDLCLHDVSGTSYVAPAELLSFASAPRGGEPGVQMLTLAFTLLDTVQSGTPASVGAPTGTTHLPSLRLVSFGPLVFTGAGAPASTHNDSGPLAVTATAARPRHAVHATPYGANGLGYSAGPLTRAEVSCTLLVAATAGLSQSGAFQAVEDAWQAWDVALRAMNTARGFASSGQIGLLVVTDAHGASWQATAELLTFEASPSLGLVGWLEIPLTFRLLEMFRPLTAGAVYGTAIYGTSRYA